MALAKKTVLPPPLLSVVALALLSFVMLAISPSAQAVPSFSRQTGVACNMCHTTSFGPNLTPYGREFKLNGYVWEKGGSDKEAYIPPISGMVVGSFTNTQKDQDKPSPNIQHFNTNNNFAFDEASLFYAGKIWGKVGAFSQLTYNGVDDVLSLDNTDIRFANQVDIFDQNVVYGISANNRPTAQDLWNTTPVWGFPYAGSSIAATPDGASLLDEGLDGMGTGQVGGATMYAMINRLLYLEAGAYASFSRDFMIGTGNYGSWGSPLNRIDGGAPYWRIALQKDLDGHYFSLGHYGMTANIVPLGQRGVGTDTYTDLALDATYQYMGSLEHIYEVKTTYLRESRDLRASSALETINAGGIPTRISNSLDTFKINAAYTYLQTYSLNFGYVKTWTHDDRIQNATGVSGGGNLGHEYFTAEFDYIPFGKDASMLATLMNLRVGLQYIGYTQFNGSQAQAGNFNTFLLNGWLAF